MVKKNRKTEKTSVRFDRDSKLFMRTFGISGADVFSEGIKALRKKRNKK